MATSGPNRYNHKIREHMLRSLRINHEISRHGRSKGALSLIHFPAFARKVRLGFLRVRRGRQARPAGETGRRDRDRIPKLMNPPFDRRDQQISMCAISHESHHTLQLAIKGVVALSGPPLSTNRTTALAEIAN